MISTGEISIPVILIWLAMLASALLVAWLDDELEEGLAA